MDKDHTYPQPSQYGRKTLEYIYTDKYMYFLYLPLLIGCLVALQKTHLVTIALAPNNLQLMEECGFY